jgi:hypothetical protein
LLFRKSHREEKLNEPHDEAFGRARSVCLMDASSDVCRDQDVMFTRAMWTSTAADACPVPFHGKRGLDERVTGAC